LLHKFDASIDRSIVNHNDFVGGAGLPGQRLEQLNE
jgi:hypothetical protein